jgi:hypothetical protein
MAEVWAGDESWLVERLTIEEIWPSSMVTSGFSRRPVPFHSLFAVKIVRIVEIMAGGPLLLKDLARRAAYMRTDN